MSTKNQIRNEEQIFIAKTISGLEEILAQELIEIGAKDVVVINRAVSFKGDKYLLYKANFTLRTAQRILMPLFSFPLQTEDDLYRQIKDYPWEDVIKINQTIAMDAVVSKSEFTHSHFVALRSKDALVDRFREKYNGRRPNVDTDDPDFRINIHIYEDKCDISLDSSGASLHKRGYRIGNAEAPLSEVLAAGLIRMSNWDKNSPFIDPMCGSGTILIEAAMYANNFPAGMYRSKFGFMNWKDFDEDLWKQVKQDAFDNVVEFEHEVLGYDNSRKNLAVAKANINNARLHLDIKVDIEDIENLKNNTEKGGVIVINPPYGERIKTKDIISLYKSIGNTLKREFTGYKAGIISADENAIKFIGLKPSKRYTVYNGQLECKYHVFELYQGSKKANKESSSDFISSKPKRQKDNFQKDKFQKDKYQKDKYQKDKSKTDYSNEKKGRRSTNTSDFASKTKKTYRKSNK
ncbi:MAG: class I SAM-dependent RNA methyltransferase [Lentimicrobiaceae bacterium]|nr:class I SAM-dependent RNA methyltransferase [Lentimicrobiaceae bacterium]